MATASLNRSPSLEPRHTPFVAPRAVSAGRLPTVERGGTNAPSSGLNLMQSFRATGGVVSGDALALFLRRHTDQPLSLLARWIVRREVLSFERHSQTLLPMFQFDLECAVVRPGLQLVMAELGDVFDNRELVDWFATPNSWLAGETPVDVFDSDLPAVLEVARADRFVATG